MKNQKIVNAYDSINPTREQKDRMLAAILQKADFEEAPVKQPGKKESIVYTAKPTRTSKKSAITAIAASLALFAVSAAVLVQMIRQPENPAYVPPTETTLNTQPDLVFPAEPTHYGIYNVIIADYAGYLDGTLANPTTIPKKLQAFMDSRDTSGLGWIVYDVDGDGIEELLISDGELIYQAMTMEEDRGGSPILFTIMEEEQYYRCQDGIFCRVSDYGGDYIQYEFFEVNMNYPGFREIQEVVICDKGQYRIGKTEETAVAVDESTAQWTLGEKYLRERLFVTPFLENETTELSDMNLTGFAPYDQILQRYYRAVEENWDTESLDRNGLPSEIARRRAYGSLGWCTLDVDNNGQEELLISDGERIYDSYTITAGGELTPLMLASKEKMLTLCQNGIFRAVYPNEGRTVYIYYKVTDEFTTPEQTIVYENGAYRAGQTEVLAQPISKDEAGRIMGEYIEQELFVTRFMPRDPDAYDTDGTYAQTLHLFRKALTEQWSPLECSASGLSMQLTEYYDSPGDIGYTFLNLDGGEEELLITNGCLIYNLYTVRDGTVEPVFIGADRHTYWFLENNRVLRRKLTPKNEEFYIVYKMVHPNISEESGLVVEEAYVRKTADDPKSPWHFSPDGSSYGELCGSFDAEKRITEMMASTQEISFRRFN